jgi:hypothetical protein
VRAESALRVRGDERCDRVPRPVVEFAITGGINGLDRAKRIADELGVLDVDELVLGMGQPKGLGPLDGCRQKLRPVFGDVGDVIGIAMSRSSPSRRARNGAWRSRTAQRMPSRDPK